VYVDGGQDLMTPVDNRDEPILDGMGVAHLLDLPGTEDVISGIGPRRPLLRDSDIVFLGYADEEEDIHDVVHSERIPSSLVSADPEAAAFRALAALSAASIIIHIDVDVLDFLQVPAADVPTYGRGLSIEDLSATLRILFGDPRCAGALLVEYNPDHDPLGRAAAQLVEMIRATASG
jgi:arginase